jgi:hypothetical protein
MLVDVSREAGKRDPARGRTEEVPPVDRSHDGRNDASRERLRELASAMDDAALERPADGEWTAGMLLAHLAFWDRFVAQRWDHAARTGRAVPINLDSEMTDLLNDASLEQWRALPGRQAVELAVAAAATVDAVIAGLDDERVQAVLDAGYTRLVDRSVHRRLHLDALDRQAGGATS